MKKIKKKIRINPAEEHWKAITIMVLFLIGIVIQFIYELMK